MAHTGDWSSLSLEEGTAYVANDEIGTNRRGRSFHLFLDNFGGADIAEHRHLLVDEDGAGQRCFLVEVDELSV